MKVTALILFMLGASCALQGAEATARSLLMTEEALDCSIPFIGDLTASGNSTLEFDACTTITSLDVPFTLYWTLLPPADDATTQPVRFGIRAKTDGAGYVALGFPRTPGLMVGANAFAVLDCANCGTLGKVETHFLGGKTTSSVQGPAQIPSSDLAAARIPGTEGGGVTLESSSLAGTFVVELPADKAAPGSPLDIIFAEGPLSASGSMTKHTSRDSMTLEL